MVYTAPLATATLDAIATRYFEAFNREDYAAVAALFHADGLLCPPFEAGIVGPAAISQYLAQEAAGMRAVVTGLESHDIHPEADHHRVVAKGRVKTPLFSVNVQWTFEIAADGHIRRADITLLAALQELLTLRPAQG